MGARRAIVTLTIGPEFEAMAEVTHPHIRAYAARVGASFYVIDQRTGPEGRPVHFEKFQAAALLESYHQVLILDTDVAVMPDAPDIFGLVPRGHFAGYDEGVGLGRAWASAEVMDELPKFKRAEPELAGRFRWNGAYLNAGVWLFDLQHRHLFREPRVWDMRFPEQTYMAILLSCYGTPVHRLDERWNFLSHYRQHKTTPGHPIWFYHVTQMHGADRLPLLKEILAGVER